MIPVDPSDTLAVLRAAEEWLSDREHWTQGAYWRNSKDDVTQVRERVCRTCAIGALSYVANGLFPTDRSRTVRMAYVALIDAVDAGVAQVNDEAGYDAIMAIYRKAIEKLEAAA